MRAPYKYFPIAHAGVQFCVGMAMGWHRQAQNTRNRKVGDTGENGSKRCLPPLPGCRRGSRKCRGVWLWYGHTISECALLLAVSTRTEVFFYFLITSERVFVEAYTHVIGCRTRPRLRLRLRLKAGNHLNVCGGGGCARKHRLKI